MIKFFLGVITGIVICTVGFTGLANMADRGVQKIQDVSKEVAK